MGGLYRRGSHWYTRIDGKKVALGTTDKQAAERKRALLERRAADPTYAATHESTLEQILNGYVRSRRRLGRSEGTIHHVRTKAGHLLRHLPEMARDLTHAELEKYIDKRLTEDAARTTIKKELRVCKAALRHGRKNGLFLADPDSVIPELEDDYVPRKRFLKPMELVSLVQALNAESPEHRAATVVFICATGARWSEALRARREDVDFALGTVTLRQTKTVRITKRATRAVPIVGYAAPLLRWALYRGNTFDGPLFPPWPSVRRALLSACKRIGIEPVSPNDLRRTFSTWLQQAGVSNELIAKVMGHTTSRMVEMVYGRIPDQDVARLLTERVGAGLEEGNHGTATIHETEAGSRSGAAETGEPLALGGGGDTGARGDHLAGGSTGARGPGVVVEVLRGDGVDEPDDRMPGEGRLSGLEKGGTLMGHASAIESNPGPITATSDSLGSSVKEPETACPGTESNRRHGDFQARLNDRSCSDKTTESALEWGTNGTDSLGDRLREAIGRNPFLAVWAEGATVPETNRVRSAHDSGAVAGDHASPRTTCELCSRPLDPQGWCRHCGVLHLGSSKFDLRQARFALTELALLAGHEVAP